MKNMRKFAKKFANEACTFDECIQRIGVCSTPRPTDQHARTHAHMCAPKLREQSFEGYLRKWIKKSDFSNSCPSILITFKRSDWTSSRSIQFNSALSHSHLNSYSFLYILCSILFQCDHFNFSLFFLLLSAVILSIHQISIIDHTGIEIIYF